VTRPVGWSPVTCRLPGGMAVGTPSGIAVGTPSGVDREERQE
jgi:hypothetical protein